MDLAHAPERIANLRRRPTDVYEDLVLVSRSLPTDSDLSEGGVLRPLIREFIAHDADGIAIATKQERVNDVDLDGELRPAVITILVVRRHVVVESLTEGNAQACGYKTATRLREAWDARHPRSPVCSVVSFTLGDVRDKPLFMAWTGRGSDYTMSPSRSIDSAEALTQDQLTALAGWNRAKDDARRAKTSRDLATETPSQRLLRLQRVVDQLGGEAAKAIRQEMRIIGQRIRRAEGRS